LVEVHAISADAVRGHPVGDLPALLTRDEVVVWVDIPTYDAEAQRVLVDVFDLHPTAVRDCERRNRVPKMHAYPQHLLVILHGPEPGERGHVHYIELDQIIARNYLITVHGPVNPAVKPAVPLRETSTVLARVEAGPSRPRSGFELSHAVVSALAHSQATYVEAVTSDAWRLEQRVTSGQVDDPEQFLTDLFRTRHGMLAVRTMAALSAGIYHQMADLSQIPQEHRAFVADAADQFDRVRAVADGEREYLQGVIEFYQSTLTVEATLQMRTQNDRIQLLTEASYQQNEQVKKISAWAAIFFAPTFIASVYGMNFDHMPEQHWVLGYPLSILLMLLSSFALYRAFKHQHWL
jgi:Mg2+ and Co2+ transporter CorA